MRNPFKKKVKPVFRTISDLDLIKESKTQVPMYLIVKTKTFLFLN
jgi:hypothetical protein